MGTLKIQRLTDAEIVALYKAGESAGLLSLKARIGSGRIREILVHHGVRIRPGQEALRLALRTRPARKSNEWWKRGRA